MSNCWKLLTVYFVFTSCKCVWLNVADSDAVVDVLSWQQLLQYARTTLLFSDRCVNVNIVSWNRLILLHGALTLRTHMLVQSIHFSVRLCVWLCLSVHLCQLILLHREHLICTYNASFVIGLTACDSVLINHVISFKLRFFWACCEHNCHQNLIASLSHAQPSKKLYHNPVIHVSCLTFFVHFIWVLYISVCVLTDLGGLIQISVCIVCMYLTCPHLTSGTDQLGSLHRSADWSLCRLRPLPPPADVLWPVVSGFWLDYWKS